MLALLALQTTIVVMPESRPRLAAAGAAPVCLSSHPENLPASPSLGLSSSEGRWQPTGKLGV